MAKNKGKGKGGAKKTKSAKPLPPGAKAVTLPGGAFHCYTKRVKNARGGGSHTRGFCRKDK